MKMNTTFSDRYESQILLFQEFPDEVEKVLLVFGNGSNGVYAFSPKKERNVRMTKLFVTTDLTITEIAEQFQISKERVRQIAWQTLWRLYLVTEVLKTRPSNNPWAAEIRELKKGLPPNPWA